MKRLLLIALLLYAFIKVSAQDNPVIPISGLPTKEVYDLLVDKKGFLWIAHDYGITRFDGTSMVNFSCPEQTSLSITDLTEDDKGRIWCHNFSGQILFVENEKLNYLKSYHFSKENDFPRIQVFQNELISTSNKGLFIYDLQTGKFKYLSVDQKPTASIASLKDKIIAYGNGSWFSYNKKSGIKKLYSSYKNEGGVSGYLHPTVYHDTLYVTRAFSNEISKLLLKGDSVLLIKKESTKSYINTIVRFRDDLFINTKVDSYGLKGSSTIKGQNLTDIILDHEGNTWYGSLKNGLSVKYKQESLAPSKLFTLANNDFIRSSIVAQNLNLFGTQQGEVILYDTNLKKILFRRKIPNAGSIEKISSYPNGCFLVSGSIGNWIFHPQRKDLVLLNKQVLKDVDIYKQNIFSATANHLALKSSPVNAESLSNQFNSTPLHGELIINEGRSRAVRYDFVTHQLYTALKDGLYVINKNGKFPVKYHGQNLHISALAYQNGKIYASDFNNGLFIIHQQKIKRLRTEDGLLSNTLLKLKIYGNHLWIFGQKSLQLFNLRTEKIDDNFLFANPEKSIVYDISEHNQSAYIATSDGLFIVPFNKTQFKPSFQTYMLYALVNNKDTLSNKQVLPYHQNNIRLDLSIPFFYKPELLSIRYRLNNEKWINGEPNQRMVNYTALTPGQYHFEAFAVDVNGNKSDQFVHFDFEIAKPWWQALWFIILAAVLASLGIWLLVRSFYMTKIKKERVAYEQLLAVETERQRIGGEIHDDISAGLSAMKLHLSLLEQKSNNETKTDIRKIYTGVADLSTHLREVIWTLNLENDKLENLIYYLQQQAVTFFEHTDIILKVSLPNEIPEYQIRGEVRKNIYLAAKEAWQNVLKHAQATEVSMEISISDAVLKISIADNGIGLASNKSIEGSGLINMDKRLQYIGGKMLKESSADGLMICFVIPMLNSLPK